MEKTKTTIRLSNTLEKWTEVLNYAASHPEETQRQIGKRFKTDNTLISTAIELGFFSLDKNGKRKSNYSFDKTHARKLWEYKRLKQQQNKITKHLPNKPAAKTINVKRKGLKENKSVKTEYSYFWGLFTKTVYN